ncbi:uncharacterized protein LOC141695786 [Apium graveolens]|uniref:uncharacterized protein LOC141695786 n=1 Tax=Apium graveolens TaxID=4045 RepID=UPI003D7BD694
MHVVGEAPKWAKTGVSMVFDDFDLEGVKFPHDDPLVIIPIIGNNPIKRVLVENGASLDILLYDTFIKMGYNDYRLTPTDMPIYGFARIECPMEGIIKLHLTMRKEPKQAMQMLKFVVVKAGSTYNAIMGRTGIHAFKEIPSSYHSVIKFLTRDKRGKPAENLIPVPLAPGDTEKVTSIGASLEDPLKGKLVRFLQENNNVFAWSVADMPGIDQELITHKLNVDPNLKTVKQKKRSFSPERQEAIKQEVEKLLEAGFNEEI